MRLVGRRVSASASLYDPANPTTRSYYILNLNPGTVTTVGIRVLNTGTATGSVSFTITAQQVSQMFQQDGPLQGPVIASTIIPVWELALIGLLFLGGLLFVWQNLRRFSITARGKKGRVQH